MGSRLKRSRLSMLSIAIGLGMDAREVGPCRVEDASPTDGVVAGTPGVVAGITTGAVAGITTGVAAGTTTGVAAGTPGMDAREVGRCRVEDARRIDSEGEASGDDFFLFFLGAEMRRAPRSCAARSAKQDGGGGRTRTYEGVSQRIYSPPPLPLGTLPRNQACGNNRAIWLDGNV